MGSFHPFSNSAASDQFVCAAAPGTMSSQTATSRSVHLMCKFQEDGLVDDCSRSKIILMHMYRDILPYSLPAYSANGERLSCPFIRCCSKFTTYQERIEHMRTCRFFRDGEYYCPDCNDFKSFFHSKGCSLVRKEGVLKRLSSSIERRLSARGSRRSSSSSTKKKISKQPETVSFPSQWEGQEPVIPPHPQEIPNPRQLDQFEEKRVELADSGAQATLPPIGPVACNDHRQLEAAKSHQQIYAPPASKVPENVVASVVPIQAPVATSSTRGWNPHLSCTSSWASCSSGSDCPWSAFNSFSEPRNVLGEAGRNQPVMMMMTEPGRICASPPPMDDTIVSSRPQLQELQPHEMPATTEFLPELAGSIPECGSEFYQEPVAEQVYLPNSSASYYDAQAGGVHHSVAGCVAEYSPPPPYHSFPAHSFPDGGPAQGQISHRDSLAQQAESFAIPTPCRTVSEDSTTLSFDSGYATDQQRQASCHDIMQVRLPRTPSPMSPQNSSFPTPPSEPAAPEDDAAGGGIIPKCPTCGWQPNPSHRPENFRPHMQRHIRTHQNTQLPCPVEGCDKTRSRSDNLRKHVREDHPECDEEDVLGPVGRGMRDPGRAISKRRKVEAKPGAANNNNFGGFWS